MKELTVKQSAVAAVVLTLFTTSSRMPVSEAISDLPSINTCSRQQRQRQQQNQQNNYPPLQRISSSPFSSYGILAFQRNSISTSKRRHRRKLIPSTNKIQRRKIRTRMRFQDTSLDSQSSSMNEFGRSLYKSSLWNIENELQQPVSATKQCFVESTLLRLLSSVSKKHTANVLTTSIDSQLLQQQLKQQQIQHQQQPQQQQTQQDRKLQDLVQGGSITCSNIVEDNPSSTLLIKEYPLDDEINRFLQLQQEKDEKSSILLTTKGEVDYALSSPTTPSINDKSMQYDQEQEQSQDEWVSMTMTNNNDRSFLLQYSCTRVQDILRSKIKDSTMFDTNRAYEAGIEIQQMALSYQYRHKRKISTVVAATSTDIATTATTVAQKAVSNLLTDDAFDRNNNDDVELDLRLFEISMNDNDNNSNDDNGTNDRTVAVGVVNGIGYNSNDSNYNSNMQSNNNNNSMESNINNKHLEQVVDMLMSYGLTVNDISDVFSHSPSVAFMRVSRSIKPEATKENDETIGSATIDCRRNNDDEDTLQETLERVVIQLLMGPILNLRKYDVRKVIRNTPGLLTTKGSIDAMNNVIILTKMGVSGNSIARDKRTLPTLLCRSPQHIFRLVAFLSSDNIRIPIASIGPILRSNKCIELLDAVAPVPWIETTTTTSTSSGGTGTASSSTRKFVTINSIERIQQNKRIDETYRQMTQTACTLRTRIGTGDFGKLVASYPSILLLDATNEIVPTAQYLMYELGICENDIPLILQLYPTLLGTNVSDMKHVVQYMISLEVSNDNLCTIFRSFPALLTLSVEYNMKPVVEFLINEIGITNIGRFITRLPPVLGYSITTEIQPKWDYLQQIMGVSDARFAISKFPAVFSYPLSRIQNRSEYLRIIKKIPIGLLSLDQILCYGDKDFAIKIGRDTDNGRSYERYLIEKQQQQQQEQDQQQPATILPKDGSQGNKTTIYNA